MTASSLPEMQMPAKRMAAVLALAAGCCSLDAAAFYYGIGAGQATDKEWDDRVIQDGSVGAIELEDSDTGFRVFGGFTLDRGLGIEIGYVNFGEQTAQGSADGSGPYWTGGPAAVENALDGLDFGLVGNMPVSDALSLIARVGVLSWENELTYVDPAFLEKYVETGNDLFFGGGAEFHPGGPLALRGEFVRYRMDDVDVDLVSASVVYRFDHFGRHGRHRRR
jgi:OOP family OmpA-OmpF porin